MVLADPLIEFQVPPELEATEPPEARGVPRDRVRLLVTSRGGIQIEDARFDELPRFLDAGDLLVANDSATLPAALTARRANGAEIQFHLSTRLDDRQWVVEPRRSRVSPGERLVLPGSASATLRAPFQNSERLWVSDLDLPEPFVDFLHHWGKPIAYDYMRGEWPIEAYQTVYAREPGSAEMPSAGRAFSLELLERLTAVGIAFATLTLHTGVASLENHESPYPEPFRIPAETAAAIRTTKANGGRVIAIGTTVVRALESSVNDDGIVVPCDGWTDLVIDPEHEIRSVDGLITGFHEPEATHLAMLTAIAGSAHLRRAYHAAIEGRYLWHEFGDLHLILP